MAELTVPARVENLGQVLSFVDGELEKLECPMKAQMQIDVAVEELYVNIASYAYAPDEGEALIRVLPGEDWCSVEIDFEDSGRPYDPLAKPDPDVTLSAAERQVGGLGIFMAKKCMDWMSYAREGNRNILRTRKAF